MTEIPELLNILLSKEHMQNILLTYKYFININFCNYCYFEKPYYHIDYHINFGTAER